MKSPIRLASSARYCRAELASLMYVVPLADTVTRARDAPMMSKDESNDGPVAHALMA